MDWKRFGCTPLEPGVHLHTQIQTLGTQMPSPDDTAKRGRDALSKELKVLNVARATARFRALPDDTGIAPKRDQPGA